MTYLIGRGRYARETYPLPPRLAESDLCPSLVLVRSLEDLPDPVAGVITLEANTNYRVCGTVDISPNSLVLQDLTTLSGESGANDAVVSVGFAAPAMIVAGAGVNAIVISITLIAPGAAIFDADMGGTGTLTLILAVLANSGSLGTVRNFARFSGVAVGIQGNSDGWTILGTNNGLLWVATRISDNVGTFTAWRVPEASGTSCVDAIFSTSIIDLGAGQTGFDFPDPANGLTIARGAISSVFFSGAGTPLATGVGKITKATPQWAIDMSPPLLDSVAIGGTSYALTGGAGNSTGVLVAGTFVAIPFAPSPFVASASNERFSASASGVLTYTGLDSIQVKITVTVSVDVTGGGTVNWGCAIFMNGGLVPNSEQTNAASTGGFATAALTTSAIVTMNNGDTVDGRIRNNTNANSMNAYSARIDALPA